MTTAEIEVATDEAIAACGGDPREAIGALILANAYLEAEVERLAEAVSLGFARGRIRSEPWTDQGR